MEEGADVNHADVHDNTVLYWASQRGHLALAEKAIEHGARVNAPVAGSGCTALHVAVSNGRMDVAKLLLRCQMA